jgi:uncharacterized heparinase superfamily protein
MAEMTFRDRLKIATLSAERSQRSGVAQVLANWLPAWPVASWPVDRLLIVPQDLRTADPSFWREIEHGQFGLAGSIAFLRGLSPFDIAPPTPAWARELHGFGWLRNLAAAADEDACRGARLLASEWAIRFGSGKGIVSEPVVAARRLISWITHATLLLEGADAATYEAITTSLGRQIALLAGSRRDAPDGYPRLVTLIALMFAELSVAKQQRRLRDIEPTLVAELRRQILPDGGHMSRNPGLLVELLLDLLPLHQCFIARDREPPATLTEALARIQGMIRYLRLGDGMIARFNGAGIPVAAGLGIILAYGDASSPPLSEARASGYARLAGGETIVVADVGSPPPLSVGGEAQAGCLSFEMSTGRHLIFVNGGMPGGAAAEWTPAARATANHNTVCIAEQSSSKLVAQHRLKPTGDLALRQPDNVTWHVESTDGDITLDADHDGYQRRFGLRHNRRLKIAKDGARLEGRDRIHAGKRSVRFKSDLPFAVHFHLHPDVSCCLRADEKEVELSLPGGELWRFTAKGAALTVEESTFFANSAGSRPAMQIVLRGATFGDSEINWTVERAPKEVPA